MSQRCLEQGFLVDEVARRIEPPCSDTAVEREQYLFVNSAASVPAQGRDRALLRFRVLLRFPG